MHKLAAFIGIVLFAWGCTSNQGSEGGGGTAVSTSAGRSAVSVTETAEPTAIPTALPSPTGLLTSCPKNLGEGVEVIREDQNFCFVFFPRTGDYVVFTSLFSAERFRDEKESFSTFVRSVAEERGVDPCSVTWVTANFKEEATGEDFLTIGCPSFRQ